METEKLAVLDGNGIRIGVASRSEVHAKGYWHETFHCWLAHYDDSRKESFVYFQLRSDNKKDYPGLLDITAAGHILADEKIEDGVREVHEELGIPVPFKELHPLGVVKGELLQEGMADREFTNVFLYTKPVSYEQFHLQREEVSGIFRSTVKDFQSLILDVKQEIDIEGFLISKEGIKQRLGHKVGYHHFVPHERSYLLEIINRISGRL
ncbi:NUDIX hydrolase [Bacillus sp. AFS015802]|uniref:NUDIX hydrolase n=1 Tax=Bacillus sp. AFS015802 TaxID=2033486 RepID=UPI000BF37EC0|nr:NUDIX domain-containing protein [Bacillus sp. AFS015802]PFA67736.1 NUDIX hydrolase [Bacillus sp. AFS015802]